MPSTTIRVRQTNTDRTIGYDELADLNAGDYVGDGMSHNSGVWTWTRNTVVANDREAKVIVVSYGDEPFGAPTFAATYDEAAHMWCDWNEVKDRRACHADEARCDYIDN
jgi:hypothetical protein